MSERKLRPDGRGYTAGRPQGEKRVLYEQAAEKWQVTYAVARRILNKTQNLELQALLVRQSKYQAQRLKDMREAVQR